MRRGIPYLMYHELSRPGRPTCRSDQGYMLYVLAETEFRQHLEGLDENGFVGFTVGRALDGEGLNENAVVITFDDGCASDLEIAAPLLLERGFGATFYITTGNLGRAGYLSDTQARELDGLGFEIGSHSVTHPYLSGLDDTALVRELVESRQRLEQLVQHPVRHLSCPGGRWSRRVARAAEAAGYVSVADSRPCANVDGFDPFRLARFPIRASLESSDVVRLARAEYSGRARLKSSALSLARFVLGDGAYDRIRSRVLR